MSNSMKTIGLMGGMSWESTLAYYRTINRATAAALGGLHSAPLVLDSLDLAEVARLQYAGDWDALGEWMAASARKLERAGADLLVLATNTMHKLAPQIEAATAVPLLHIADATADAARAHGIGAVGLIGTRFTMEQDFYRERLEANGLQVLIPPDAERQVVHDVIYDELCRGRFEEPAREAYRQTIARLAARGAEGVIAGCTEIGLLVRPSDSVVPLFDTTRIHAEEAVELALET
jgi:aspartate racemase